MKKDDIITTFESTVKDVDERKIDDLISKENLVEKKRRRLNLNLFLDLFKQIGTAFSLIKDYRNKKYRDISWKSIAVLVAAIIYFLSPLDVIPDFLGALGFTDDAIVLSFVFNSIKDELEKYTVWKVSET